MNKQEIGQLGALILWGPIIALGIVTSDWFLDGGWKWIAGGIAGLALIAAANKLQEWRDDRLYFSGDRDDITNITVR